MTRSNPKGHWRREEFWGFVVGCTYYPLIKNIFEKGLQKLKVKAEIIDPAGVCHGGGG